MNKFIITTCTMLAMGVLNALPVGNPATAHLLMNGLIWEDDSACIPCPTWCDAWSLRIGFYGDYVFNNYLKVKRSDAVIDYTEMYTNAGYLALNFYNRIDIFATFGATDMAILTDSNAFGGENGFSLSIGSVTDFSWSLGLDGILWQWGCTVLGAEGQYFYTKPDLKYIYSRRATTIYDDNHLDFKYQEWQVGLALAHHFRYLSPYVGVKCSYATLSFDNAVFNHDVVPLILYDLKSQRSWGFAVGATLINCDFLNVTVEGRFGNQQALYVNGQLRF